jgi:hypothetical protein
MRNTQAPEEHSEHEENPPRVIFDRERPDNFIRYMRQIRTERNLAFYHAKAEAIKHFEANGWEHPFKNSTGDPYVSDHCMISECTKCAEVFACACFCHRKIDED